MGMFIPLPIQGKHGHKEFQEILYQSLVILLETDLLLVTLNLIQEVMFIYQLTME
jgi:hypothetical protein